MPNGNIHGCAVRVLCFPDTYFTFDIKMLYQVWCDTLQPLAFEQKNCFEQIRKKVVPPSVDYFLTFKFQYSSTFSGRHRTKGASQTFLLPKSFFEQNTKKGCAALSQFFYNLLLAQSFNIFRAAPHERGPSDFEQKTKEGCAALSQFFSNLLLAQSFNIFRAARHQRGSPSALEIRKFT